MHSLKTCGNILLNLFYHMDGFEANKRHGTLYMEHAFHPQYLFPIITHVRHLLRTVYFQFSPRIAKMVDKNLMWNIIEIEYMV